MTGPSAKTNNKRSGYMQSEESISGAADLPGKIKAAEYVRMSTEHQQYSTENQSDRIRDYAAHNGIEIVRTYADAGKSGLNIDGRLASSMLRIAGL